MDEQERRLEISKQNQDYGKDRGDCENIALHYAEKCEKLEQRITELRAALKKYGNCLDSCSFRQGLKSNSFEQCDCGLEQALKGK